MNKVNFLGIKVDNISFQNGIKIINNFILLKKPHQIVTVNPEFVISAQKDDEFKNILNSADLSVPDGAGLIFVSKYILHNPIKERITGIDLMWKLSEEAAVNKFPIFLLGAQKGVAEKTALNLKKHFPGLIISGTFSGNPQLDFINYEDHRNFRMNDVKPTKKDPNLEIIKKVNRAKPKILFVAYGAPKQDKFISRYKKVLNVPVMIGVGGSFDYISGKAKRAPKWMQKFGLEWLWRVFHEPWRLKRIFTALIIFPYKVLLNKYFKA